MAWIRTKGLASASAGLLPLTYPVIPSFMRSPIDWRGINCWSDLHVRREQSAVVCRVFVGIRRRLRNSKCWEDKWLAKLRTFSSLGSEMYQSRKVSSLSDTQLNIPRVTVGGFESVTLVKRTSCLTPHLNTGWLGFGNKGSSAKSMVWCMQREKAAHETD